MPPLRGLLVGFAIRVRLVFRESGVNMTGVIVREPRFVDWLHDTVRGGVSWCLLAVLEHVAPHINNIPMGLTTVFRESGLVFPDQSTWGVVNCGYAGVLARVSDID
jgi:hypothetical protein